MMLQSFNWGQNDRIGLFHTFKIGGGGTQHVSPSSMMQSKGDRQQDAVVTEFLKSQSIESNNMSTILNSKLSATNANVLQEEHPSQDDSSQSRLLRVIDIVEHPNTATEQSDEEEKEEASKVSLMKVNASSE